MNELLKEWYASKRLLDVVKKDEMNLRNKVALLNPTDIGSTEIFADELIQVKLIRGIRRTINESELSKITSELSAEELACVVTKLSLDARKYNELDENSTLSRAVTVKPSQPSISVKLLEQINEEE